MALEIEANKDSLNIKTYGCSIKLWLRILYNCEQLAIFQGRYQNTYVFSLKEKTGKVDGSIYSVKLTFLDTSWLVRDITNFEF